MPIDKLVILLTGTYWETGLENYDFFQWISFFPDGKGHMRYGHTQGLRLVAVGFIYKYLDRQTFHIEFFDYVHDFWGPLFKRTDQNAYKELSFRIVENEYSVTEPFCSKPTLFRYRLTFDKEPFPQGYEPDIQRLEYYGWQFELKNETKDVASM